jgi:hypothetical protein
MDFTAFSTKWFTLYYLTIGIALIGSGLYLFLKKQKAKTYLLDASDNKEPPRLFLRIVKYFLLFSLPGLILSFTPFSWIELLFTLWSLLLVYISGIRLVHWEQSSVLIKTSTNDLSDIIRRTGAIMVAVGLALFLLAYFTIQRTSF